MTHRRRHRHPRRAQASTDWAKPKRYPAPVRESIRLAALLAATLSPAGCVEAFLPGVPAGFDSPDPNLRLHAIAASQDEPDAHAIPALIDALDAPDPAARLLAIGELRRRTGETMGYDHAASPADRRGPIDAWEDWWRARTPPAAATDPEPQ